MLRVRPSRLIRPVAGFALIASLARGGTEPAVNNAAVAPSIKPPDLSCDACRMVLLDPSSVAKDSVDAQIAQTQARIKSGGNTGPQVERLGWLFVEKARASSDPGFYKLAEQCAVCLESANTNSLDAALLKGHVYQSLHRFKEAESLAGDLVKRRGLAFDYGLLGDVAYDEGKIVEAVAAYQHMVDLRPDLQSYSRVAQVRWITGDLPGAVEAMTMAAQAGSPLNAEPTAWTFSRLALLQLQSGDRSSAKRSASIALGIQSNCAPALLALGRVALAEGEITRAIESFQKAAALSHLPESQWLVADALHAAGRRDEASAVENELKARGASEDPRSFSLYLATRGVELDLALTLAQRELETRTDIFTHDALAWAFKGKGQTNEARVEMRKALAANTQDARLFFHAAVISDAAGDKQETRHWARLAWNFNQMLFPSELEQLYRIAPREKYNIKPN